MGFFIPIPDRYLIKDNDELAEDLSKTIWNPKADSKAITPIKGLSHLYDRDWSVEDWNVSLN